MKHFLPAFFILTLSIFSSCTKSVTNSCKGTAIPDCLCTQQYDPVCGCDGKTYGNSCEAKCAGLKSWTAGKCQ